MNLSLSVTIKYNRFFLSFFNKTGFHHVGQADLGLLDSSDPPALAPQSAGTRGMSHVPGLFGFILLLLLLGG